MVFYFHLPSKLPFSVTCLQREKYACVRTSDYSDVQLFCNVDNQSLVGNLEGFL